MKWNLKVNGEAMLTPLHGGYKAMPLLAEHGSPSKLLKVLTVKLLTQQTTVIFLLPSTSLETSKVAMFHSAVLNHCLNIANSTTGHLVSQV